MNKIKRMQAKIDNLRQENEGLKQQKAALEKIAAKYQILMGSIDKNLKNWQILLKQYEEHCEKHNISLLQDVPLEVDIPNVPEGTTLTYKQIITAEHTFYSLKKEGETTEELKQLLKKGE